MGKDLERALWRMYAPHKVKLAVSGCPRNCAESGIKDVGVIGVDSGWEIYVGGNGGIKTEVGAVLRASSRPPTRCWSTAGAFLQLYREEGWYLERTVHYVNRVGLDYVKKKVLEDHEGRKALWERLQFALDGEPDPWFEHDKAPVDTRQFAKLAGAGAGSMKMNDWTVICRVEDIPVLGSRRVARPQGMDVAVFRNDRGPGVRPARPLPAQGRAAVAGHRVRHQRGLPAAQLDHRAGRRLRQGAGRRLHPRFACKVDAGEVLLNRGTGHAGDRPGCRSGPCDQGRGRAPTRCGCTCAG